MKHRFIAGYICGTLMFGAAGVFAGQYIATENPFPIKLNGNDISMEGYNVEGSTYFKLRDIADVVGGFDVDFNNDTIQLAKDGYVYDNIPNIAYYPEGCDFAPDYAAYFNVESIYDDASDAYGLYYQTDCILHGYEYDALKIQEYEDLLVKIGCSKIYTSYGIDIFAKNNNYVMISYNVSTGTNIGIYPINDPDYNVLLDDNILIGKIEQYRSNIIHTWKNGRGDILQLINDSVTANSSLAPVGSSGFYEIFGTHVSCHFQNIDGTVSYYKFEYVPETNQLKSLDDGSIYNIAD